MNAPLELPKCPVAQMPARTPMGLLYTISRYKLGMTPETATQFVDACLRFANDKPDPAPEAA